MQAPLPSQHNHTAPAQTQQVQNMDESALYSGDISDGIRTSVLKHRIMKAIEENKRQGVHTSVNIYDVREARSILDYDQTKVHFAASINKIPIAWQILQDLRDNKTKMSDSVTWQASDIRAGYGEFDQPGAPTSATVEDLLYDMLNRSGNTAVRALVNYKLGGAEAVNMRLAQYPQLKQTRLQPLEGEGNRFYVGNTTSKEAMWIFDRLLSKPDKYEGFMRNALQSNIFDDFGVRTQLEGNDYIILANKVGILDDADGNNRHDVGIIYNTKSRKIYGYSFMTTTPHGNTQGTWRAHDSLKHMGHDVLRYSGNMPKKDYKKQQNQLKQQLDNKNQAARQTEDQKVLY